MQSSFIAHEPTSSYRQIDPTRVCSLVRGSLGIMTRTALEEVIQFSEQQCCMTLARSEPSFASNPWIPLALSRSIRSHQSGEPGLCAAPKLTGVCRNSACQLEMGGSTPARQSQSPRPELVACAAGAAPSKTVFPFFSRWCTSFFEKPVEPSAPPWRRSTGVVHAAAAAWVAQGRCGMAERPRAEALVLGAP